MKLAEIATNLPRFSLQVCEEANFEVVQWERTPHYTPGHRLYNATVGKHYSQVPHQAKGVQSFAVVEFAVFLFRYKKVDILWTIPGRETWRMDFLWRYPGI